MANFNSGVVGYVHTEATVEVNFPITPSGQANVACKYCPYLSGNERSCQLNKETVAYPMKFVGDKCPLKEVVE